MGQFLKVVHGGKNKIKIIFIHSFILNRDSLGLEMITRWGHLPISMVLNSGQFIFKYVFFLFFFLNYSSLSAY